MRDGLVVKRLDKENLNDFISFFDDRAFCDNPDWAACYCCFFYFPDDEEWESRSSKQNRNCAGDYIGTGKMNGFLAYRGGDVAGWCNADRKDNFPRIIADPEIEDDGGQGAALVCFVTDPEHRRTGVATGLLEAVCKAFKEDGFEYVEAYPRRTQEGDAGNYHGPAALYESAGFSLFKEAGEFLILRKYLA